MLMPGIDLLPVADVTGQLTNWCHINIEAPETRFWSETFGGDRNSPQEEEHSSNSTCWVHALCKKLPLGLETGAWSLCRTEPFQSAPLSVVGVTLECLNQQNLGSFGGEIYLMPGLIRT